MQIAMIGMGTPEEARSVVRSLDLPFPVLLDSSRRVYELYGLIEADARAFLNRKSAAAVGRALLNGSRGGRPIGDPRQLGGAFLIDTDGTIRWAKRSHYAGDHADVEEILVAADPVLAPERAPRPTAQRFDLA